MKKYDGEGVMIWYHDQSIWFLKCLKEGQKDAWGGICWHVSISCNAKRKLVLRWHQLLCLVDDRNNVGKSIICDEFGWHLLYWYKTQEKINVGFFVSQT